MKRMRYLAVLLVLGILLAIGGCGQKTENGLNPKEPVVITLWHAYNAVVKEKFDALVLQFNETVGVEKGIVVDARGFGATDELEEALYASVNEVIGSDPLPDIFASYPDNACRLDQMTPLVNLEDYFTEEDLAHYQKAFLEEGIWDETGSHKMIPVAKSTELFYLNRTVWEQFSAETGVSKELLATWEGLVEVAERYYEWSGGSPFLGINSYSDFAMLTAAQLGEEIYRRQDSVEFCYSPETARKVWDVYYVPHIRGWYDSSVYNQDGIKSGRLAAYIGSSAGAGFFPAAVIMDETQSYPIECEILPFPTFQNGTAYLTQRGANMAIFVSDTAHEYASAQFLKWFTDPEQNVPFAAMTGYLPVEKEAVTLLGEYLDGMKADIDMEAIAESLRVSLAAMKLREFHVRPVFQGSYERNQIFATSLEEKTLQDEKELDGRVRNGEERENVAAEFLTEENFMNWYESLLRQMDGKQVRHADWSGNE